MNATLNQFACFLPDYRAGLHAIGSDPWHLVLLAEKPEATALMPTDLALAGVECSYTLKVRAAQTPDGDTAVLAANLSVRASRGIAPFRYLAIWAGANRMVGWFDAGGTIALDAGDTLDVLLTSGPLLLIPPENPTPRLPVLGAMAPPIGVARILWKNAAGKYRVPRSLLSVKE